MHCRDLPSRLLPDVRYADAAMGDYDSVSSSTHQVEAAMPAKTHFARANDLRPAFDPRLYGGKSGTCGHGCQDRRSDIRFGDSLMSPSPRSCRGREWRRLRPIRMKAKAVIMSSYPGRSRSSSPSIEFGPEVVGLILSQDILSPHRRRRPRNSGTKVLYRIVDSRWR